MPKRELFGRGRRDAGRPARLIPEEVQMIHDGRLDWTSERGLFCESKFSVLPEHLEVKTLDWKEGCKLLSELVILVIETFQEQICHAVPLWEELFERNDC